MRTDDDQVLYLVTNAMLGQHVTGHSSAPGYCLIVQLREVTTITTPHNSYTGHKTSSSADQQFLSKYYTENSHINLVCRPRHYQSKIWGTGDVYGTTQSFALFLIYIV